MRVGFTTSGCDGGRSGIGQYATHLLKHLRRLSSEIELDVLHIAHEHSAFELAHHEGPPLPRWLRQPVLNVAWHQLGLPRWSRRRRHDVLFLPAANRRVPLWSPCPTVGTVHDLSSLHVPGKYDPARTFYITRVLPRLLRGLTRVITVSDSTKRDLVEFARVPEERISVIPLGVDTSVFFPRDPAVCGRRLHRLYGIRSPYLLYISRIEHPGKNHVRLIEVFERLKATTGIPHQLVLVGGDCERADEVHALARRSSAAADILFTGFVPNAAIPDLYGGAEMFVFPSLYEGFGLPILEAMACGTPVACAGVSSLPEVAGDAALLFDPHDSANMADIITYILTDQSARETCIARGLSRARNFSWSDTAARTLEVIHAAAHSSPASHSPAAGSGASP